MTKTETVINIGRQIRAASVQAESFDAAANTIDVVWTTGADVLRYDLLDGAYIERLATAPANVRLDRLNAGAAFLDTHNSFGLGSVIGSVVPGSARMDGGLGLAPVKLSSAARSADTVQDIRDGIIRNVSVGYNVYAFTRTEGEAGEPAVLEATDWEPCEISAVPVPADAGAGIRAARSDAGEINQCTITRINSEDSNLKYAKRDAEDAKDQTEDERAEDCKDDEDKDARKRKARDDDDSETKDKDKDDDEDRDDDADESDDGEDRKRSLTSTIKAAIAKERKRVAALTSTARKHGFDDLAAEHIERGTSKSAFNEIVLDAIAERGAPSNGPAIGASTIADPVFSAAKRGASPDWKTVKRKAGI